MERDEAKHILELCRPGSDDDRQDPLVAEALRKLAADPELQAWFDEQQAVDARISQAYAALAAPADLKASILQGMRAHALQCEREQATTAKLPGSHDPMDLPTTRQAWWRNPWIGIAAIFAVLLSIANIPQQRSAQSVQTENPALSAGIPDMIQFLAGELSDIGSRGGFDKASRQPEELQTYLASIGSPSPAKLPDALKGNASLGCFTLDYNGASISMICFQYDQVVHLITLHKSDCPRSFRPEQPTIYQVDDQAFKAWTDGEHVYILSTKGSKEKLPKVI